MWPRFLEVVVVSRVVDVRGYCPACGAASLHVVPGAGFVHCLAPGCVDSGAAHRVLGVRGVDSGVVDLSSGDVVERARAEVARIDGRDGPYCVDCQDGAIGVDTGLVEELVSALERLRAVLADVTAQR